VDKQDKDVIAKFIMVIGVLVILAVVAFLVAKLASTVDSNSTVSAESDEFARMQLGKINERIAPIGHVVSGEIATGPVVRSGKEVVETTCNSCHSSGVLGAPKMGDAADWSARFGQGMETLLANATNGKGSMPPRGGDGNLSDEDLKKAVIYMLKESGQSVEGGAGATETKQESKEPAPVKKEAAPEKAEISKAAEGATEAVAVATAATDSGAGEETYKTACALCHDNGVAGAPKLGDKDAWADRIAGGADALYNTAINGKGAMPPKGGRMDLSDDAIKAAVDYMMDSVQ